MQRLKRKIDKFLIDWKENPERLPLIIKGARQTGKPNAIRYFGKNNYKVFIEINFALNPEFKTIFDSLYENCASIGLFIVPVGELESWLTDYGVGKQSNKSKWIISALENLPDVSDESKAIWRFLKKLQEFLSK